MNIYIYPSDESLNYWKYDRSWFWLLIRNFNWRCAFGLHAPPYSPEQQDESCQRCGDGRAWKYRT